jgi:hypothetical protein
MSEEFKGKMKEAYGAMTGDEGKKAVRARLSRGRPQPPGRRGRRREPAKSRPRLRKWRRSATGKSARTRAYWATWETRCRGVRRKLH